MKYIKPEFALEAIEAFENKHGTELTQSKRDCISWNKQDRPHWSFKGVRLPLYRWTACAAHLKVIHIGEDQVVRHMCDNPHCFNPDHLVFGNRAENNSDRAWKS